MPRLVYILHSGQLYGTERMALATLVELAAQVQPLLLAPLGPVHAEAARLGIAAQPFASLRELARLLWRFSADPELKICSTGVSQALLAWGFGALRGHPPTQLHVVHGGTDERLSYARKHWLQPLGVELVAVSAFVAERLRAHRCSPRRLTVIENFLAGSFPQRPAAPHTGVRQVAMITRLDPIKQVELAVQCWNALPAGQRPRLRICGTGWQQEALREQAAANDDIELLGFVADPLSILLDSDLYLHTCASEPFGLAILEAMVVGVPVLVPDRGGAALLVEPGRTGFHYRAGDAADLQRQLAHIARLSAAELAAIVAAAREQLHGRFSAQQRCKDYAALLGLEVCHGQ